MLLKSCQHQKIKKTIKYYSEKNYTFMFAFSSAEIIFQHKFELFMLIDFFFYS